METLEDKYNCYVINCNDGNGKDITTGKDIKTFNEWLDS